MIAHVRRIVENAAQRSSQLYGNTFQRWGDRQRLSAIAIAEIEKVLSRWSGATVSRYMETHFSDRAIVIYPTIIADDRPIAEKCFLVIAVDRWQHFQHPAIFSDHVETRLQKLIAIVGDREQSYTSVIPAIRQSWTIIWKLGLKENAL